MSKLNIETTDRRVKWGLLIVSLVTLGLLVVSALQENVFVEWRTLRLEYAKRLDAKATDARGKAIAEQFEIGIDHNVVPELGATDRCITCHTGVDDPRMAAEKQPFRAHPGDFLMSHPPETFGCTVCHQGQGLATESAAAHGRVPHWPYPMLEKQFMYAACAKCHDEQSLYGDEQLLVRAAAGESRQGAMLMTEGKRILEEKGCLGCHVLNGRGGTLGLDITYVGDKTEHDFDFSHFDRDEPREVAYWLKKHFLEPAEITPDTLMPDMGLSEAEAEALTAYVLSFRGKDIPASHLRQAPAGRRAPEPYSGGKLYKMYCSACHGQNGEASEVPGIRTPALNNRDSLAAAGNDYYRFIVAQGRSGTNMPAWGPRTGNLTQGEIDGIVSFIRGWGKSGAPVSEVSSSRGDAGIGGVYFRTLCANCHGKNGEGGIGNALNSRTFLSIASDRFLAENIIHGRPGTAMASWKHLSSEAVSDLVAYIRSRQPEPPGFEAVRTILARDSFGDEAGLNTSVADTGRILYRANCSGCHGQTGEGGIGLTLNTPDLLRVVDDEYLYRAIAEGRPTTAMPRWGDLSAEHIAALIAYLRTWQPGTPATLPEPPRRGDYALGEVHYKVSCVGCHGEDGRGGVGPQIANPAFLRAVSDDVLHHWIGRGRAGTAMKGFLDVEQGIASLTSSQIADVVAYLRYLGSRDEHPILRTGVGNPFLGGQLFQGSCSSCHGVNGEGSSGPQLNNPTFLRTASDGFLAGTIVMGRTGTPMRSMIHGQEGLGQITPSQVQDVISYLRLWDRPERWRKPRAIAEMSARAIRSGEQKFGQFCAGCHGPSGLGEKDGPGYFAPALNNPEFLTAASDGFLIATIARGRGNTPMRPFGQNTGGIAALSAGDINDIVSYVRTWQETPP